MIYGSTNHASTFLHRTVFVCLLCFSGAFAMSGFAQEAPQQARNDEAVYFAATKEWYEFDKWPKGAARDGVPLASLEIAGYQREPIHFIPDTPVFLRYADSRAPRFLIELSVCETTADAHERLITLLAHVSSPNKVPKSIDLGFAVGDIGFVGRAPADALAWIAFVRGNILVRVCNLDPREVPQPPMQRVAERIDRIILAQSIVERGNKISRPAIDLRCTEKSSCTAGESIPLSLQVQSLSNTAAAVNWVLDGPGQGYVEKDDAGTLRLYSTKAGKIRLVCHVLGEKGTCTKDQINLTIN